MLGKGPLIPYTYKAEGGLRSYVWDRAISHSIGGDAEDGFLLPYHAILDRAAQDDSLDPREFVAAAPGDRRMEFSYAGEHVTHDGGIAALLSVRASLERCRVVSGISVDPMLEWVDATLGELWKLRGPTPGLGAVLAAFGFLRANAVAHHVVEAVGENANPWPYFDALVDDPEPLPRQLLAGFTPMIRAAWRNVRDNDPDRRALVELLARFELTAEQATRLYRPEARNDAGISCTDQEILENPYILYERDRISLESVSVWTVDGGVFPVAAVRRSTLFERSSVTDHLDARRIRSLTVEVLERAALDGQTLQSQAVW